MTLFEENATDEIQRKSSLMMGMGGHIHGAEHSPDVTATLTEDK